MSPAERGAYFSVGDDKAFEGFTFVHESAAHLVNQALTSRAGSVPMSGSLANGQRGSGQRPPSGKK